MRSRSETNEPTCRKKKKYATTRAVQQHTVLCGEGGGVRGGKSGAGEKRAGERRGGGRLPSARADCRSQPMDQLTCHTCVNVAVVLVACAQLAESDSAHTRNPKKGKKVREKTIPAYYLEYDRCFLRRETVKSCVNMGLRVRVVVDLSRRETIQSCVKHGVRVRVRVGTSTAMHTRRRDRERARATRPGAGQRGGRRRRRQRALARELATPVTGDGRFITRK